MARQARLFPFARNKQRQIDRSNHAVREVVFEKRVFGEGGLQNSGKVPIQFGANAATVPGSMDRTKSAVLNLEIGKRFIGEHVLD